MRIIPSSPYGHLGVPSNGGCCNAPRGACCCRCSGRVRRAPRPLAGNSGTVVSAIGLDSITALPLAISSPAADRQLWMLLIIRRRASTRPAPYSSGIMFTAPPHMIRGHSARVALVISTALRTSRPLHAVGILVRHCLPNVVRHRLLHVTPGGAHCAFEAVRCRVIHGMFAGIALREGVSSCLRRCFQHHAAAIVIHAHAVSAIALPRVVVHNHRRSEGDQLSIPRPRLFICIPVPVRVEVAITTIGCVRRACAASPPCPRRSNARERLGAAIPCRRRVAVGAPVLASGPVKPWLSPLTDPGQRLLARGRRPSWACGGEAVGPPSRE